MQLINSQKCRIKYFPVSFFSIILGLAGFVIALQKIEVLFALSFKVSNLILWFTVIIFTVILFFYLIKIIKFKEEVREEFNQPVKLGFFPTFSISLLLLSIAFLSFNLTISRWFFFIGAISHFILTIKIISIWIQHDKFKIKHMNPAWFIPAVGNVLVPVAGVKFFPAEVNWFFFSVGFVFWIVLLVIFFNRIIFHSPLPQKLLPTLFILIAPPAVGFISFVKLTGRVDEFAKVLYYFALFLVFLLFAQIKLFYKIKYYLSWWAYSFPIAAITIASVLMFHKSEVIAFKYIALSLFGLLSLIIMILLIKTVAAIHKKEICVEEE